MKHKFETPLRFLTVIKSIVRRLKTPLKLVSTNKGTQSQLLEKSDDNCFDEYSISSTLVDCWQDKPNRDKALTADTVLQLKTCGKTTDTHKTTNTPENPFLLSYAADLSALAPDWPDRDVLRVLDVLGPAFPLIDPSSDLRGLFDEISWLASGSNKCDLVKQRALELILIQIRSGHTLLLADVLSQQRNRDVSMLLAELMISLPDYWMEAHRLDMHIALQAVWGADHSHETLRKAHAALPYIQFLLQLIQSSSSMALAVLNAGFIDMLVHMSRTGFPDSRTPKADTSRWVATSSLIECCVVTLEALTKYPDVRDLMTTRWVVLAECWPRNYSRNLIALKPIPPHVESLRVCRDSSFQRLNTLWTNTSFEGNALYDICNDILTFTRRALYDTDIVHSAIALLLQYISCKDRQGVWLCLRPKIMKSPYNVVVDLFFDLTSQVLSRFSMITYYLDFVEFMMEGSLVMRTVAEEAGVFLLQSRAMPIIAQARRKSLQDLDAEPRTREYLAPVVVPRGALVTLFD